MSTHKRFPTVGGNGKVIDPVSAVTPARKFGTVKAAATVAPKRSSQPVASQRDYPFDLDGTERVVGTKVDSVTVGATTVPMLRRPSAVITPVIKAKAKPVSKVKVDKLVPAAKAKLPKASATIKKAGEKPALAKRNAKAVPEVTAPVMATKPIKVTVKTDNDIGKLVGAVNKVLANKKAATKSKPAKPGKIADKKAYENAKKAGVITETPKAKATPKKK